MRKCKRLLKQGPLCIQETKWSGSQKETVHQHIPGLQIAETHAIRTRQGNWSGGTAILIPPGFTLKNWHVLVDGKAVVALVSDRGSSFNIVSIHLHPEQVRQDLLAVLSAWDKCEKVEAGILVQETSIPFFCLDAAWLNEVVVRAVALLSAKTKWRVAKLLEMFFQVKQQTRKRNETTPTTLQSPGECRGRVKVACSSDG